ncbi:hypothetical protein [Micromonospora sp. NPDC003241]
MRGAELARLVRDNEILRLRTEENMTYRQIGERVGISHVMVGHILNALIGTTEENIRERRSQLAEMQERVMVVAYEKYLETKLATDLQAFVKIAESYKSTFGLNTPTVNVSVSDYGNDWSRIFNDQRTVDGTIVQ